MKSKMSNMDKVGLNMLAWGLSRVPRRVRPGLAPGEGSIFRVQKKSCLPVRRGGVL